MLGEQREVFLRSLDVLIKEETLAAIAFALARNSSKRAKRKHAARVNIVIIEGRPRVCLLYFTQKRYNKGKITNVHLMDVRN